MLHHYTEYTSVSDTKTVFEVVTVLSITFILCFSPSNVNAGTEYCGRGTNDTNSIGRIRPVRAKSSHSEKIHREICEK